MRNLIYTVWSALRADPTALVLAGSVLILVIIAAAIAEAQYERRH